MKTMIPQTIHKAHSRLLLTIATIGLALSTLAVAQSTSGIVSSIAKAPITFNGTVAGQFTDFVITLDTSLDPAVPGRSLSAGNSIRITLPAAFQYSGEHPFLSVGEIPDCVPGNFQCNSGVLLQGWPQHPIAPPAQKYSVRYEGDTNTIVYTALEDLGPQGPSNPGIKQIHLILPDVTNPEPGFYPVEVTAQTGPGGAVETGTGMVQILARSRPAINLTSAMNEGSPNTIYQQAAVGNLAPLPYDLLLWDADGAPLDSVTLEMVGSDRGLLKQGEWTVGQIFIDAPAGAAGFGVAAAAPSSVINSPVSGIPTGHLRVAFQAGSLAGTYAITFALDGGNAVRTFVNVE